MSSDIVPQLLLMFLFLFLSGLFSLIKFSFDSMNAVRLEKLEEDNVKNYGLIEKLVEKKDLLDSSLLIADYLSNTAAAGFAIIIGYNLGEKLGVFIAIFAITILILIFGEITPYALSVQISEKVVKKLCRLSNIIMVLFSPFNKLVQLLSSIFIVVFGGRRDFQEPKITEDELISAVNLSREAGLLDIEELDIIENIFNFKGSYVREVMTPRMDIASVDVDDSIRDIIKVFDDEGYSRLPVYEDDLDNVIGILHAKDLLTVLMDTDNEDMEHIDITEIVRPAFFTFEYQKTQILFAEMRAARVTTAIVLDEYGGTEGLITLEDLLEEIVGEIEDEYDEEEMDDFIEIHPNEYSVDAMMRISEVNEELGLDLESDEFDTIGGFVIGLFDRFPSRGEYIDFEDCRFTVTETGDKRIVRLKIKLIEHEELSEVDE